MVTAIIESTRASLTIVPSTRPMPAPAPALAAWVTLRRASHSPAMAPAMGPMYRAERPDDHEHDGQYGQRAGQEPFPIVMMAGAMCRNIKTLFNFDPPATDEEVRAAALQFVRKLSGFNKPSQANREAFDTAIDEVAQVARRLLDGLVTSSPSRDRLEVAERARARAADRFGRAAAP